MYIANLIRPHKLRRALQWRIPATMKGDHSFAPPETTPWHYDPPKTMKVDFEGGRSFGADEDPPDTMTPPWAVFS